MRWTATESGGEFILDKLLDFCFINQMGCLCKNCGRNVEKGISDGGVTHAGRDLVFAGN